MSAPLAAQAPAVHLINAPDAQSKPVFGVVPLVRVLPNGSLLVNDVQKRQLTLLDQCLCNGAVIADSIAGTATSYGTRPGGLIAYVGDSSLFVDPAGLSMFVIGPTGKIARVASVPRSQDAGAIGTNGASNPGLDAKGRLVYRANLTLIRSTNVAPSGRGSGSGGGNGAPAFTPPEFPDSQAIVRVDLATRKLDTAAFFKIARTKMKTEQTDRGISMTSETNPMPVVDDWAVLADGSIAIVRGQDYHIDFIDANGASTSSTKLPFDWQRLDDEAKAAVIDSAKKAFETARAAAANAPAGSPTAALPGDGAPRMVFNMAVGGGDGGGGGGVGQRIMAGGGLGAGVMGNVSFVSPADLPDYRPAFSAGSARGDADGNLWIRTTATRPAVAGPIYDVVSRSGALIDRIQIPAGRQIVGFGKGGAVFMLARDASGNWIERTHR
ncbi:MAG TPA: hypothetical protein VH277_02615 [Gemmatimonadaceae bacterium]|nr:hypothetical protein [Gemmatimonadaceae bacterium]